MEAMTSCHSCVVTSSGELCRNFVVAFLQLHFIITSNESYMSPIHYSLQCGMCFVSPYSVQSQWGQIYKNKNLHIVYSNV